MPPSQNYSFIITFFPEIVNPEPEKHTTIVGLLSASLLYKSYKYGTGNTESMTGCLCAVFYKIRKNRLSAVQNMTFTWHVPAV